MDLYSAYFEVPGAPATKRRSQVIMLPDGKGGKRPSITSTGAVKSAQARFEQWAQPHAPPAPLEGAVSITIVFEFPIPKSRPKWWKQAAEEGLALATARNFDVDNLTKLALDAMTKVGFWIDDGQVTTCKVQKRYGAAPKTRVWVRGDNSVTNKEDAAQMRAARDDG